MYKYSEYSDHDLVRLIQQGDRAAFEQMYHRHAESIYRFAYHILKDEAECMDAIQEVFVWFWANRETVQVADPGPYLRTAVKYRLTRYIQSSRRRAEILSHRGDLSLELTDTSLEVKELRQVIDHFLSTLPPRSAQIFHLSRNEYLSNREIAQKMGISEKTVENQMTIVLRKLRIALGKMQFWSTFL
ncbi:RNA polymerase sigma-70 factor [Chitinophaga barathri]|uniref:RNA polymerase sigma-70 factor n=1 Tax=Chitinophaga barathri TaxID=1647451 RepID=A0A3N4MLL5_9BACT|nr:RNA polymerase sigma-70 factor [Chitinophaga barathri]RPD42956.1 RNA polymerase sigma-70 factor [Chitinophaga barathri]